MYSIFFKTNENSTLSIAFFFCNRFSELSFIRNAQCLTFGNYGLYDPKLLKSCITKNSKIQLWPREITLRIANVLTDNLRKGCKQNQNPVQWKSHGHCVCKAFSLPENASQMINKIKYCLLTATCAKCCVIFANSERWKNYLTSRQKRLVRILRTDALF